ncbi:hypothetical protein SY88_06360 [Clostridiales bacterium PH28_bin88]|nr:hypothetical protein SY88_06360 [Clostridiales bacterium PH28_bin88]
MMEDQTFQEMPDLIGMTLERAEDLLRRAGFQEIRYTITKPPGKGRFSGECRVVQQKYRENHQVSLVVAYPYYQKDTAEGGCT